MARYVKVASVLFKTEAKEKSKDAHNIILKETRKTLENVGDLGVDLVVLAENIGAWGQTIKEAEEIERPGDFLKLYSEMSYKHKMYIVGSVKIKENNKVYNSLVLTNPEGKIIAKYYKNYLPPEEIEEGLTSGKDPVVVDTPIGRIGFIICFDLNFVEFRNRYSQLKPDILVFSSMYHGGLVQGIWAYECRSYFVSALPFIGGGILDPFGREIATTNCYVDIARAKINIDKIMISRWYHRGILPKIEKKYGEEVKIDIPANIGVVMITSESDKRTAMDIKEEFGLTLVDEYFDEARKQNEKNRK